jgi:S1-C subfamily serine protease
MIAAVLLACFPGKIETVPSTDFPKRLQVAAITATVLVVDRSRQTTGSGVIIGRSGPYVYLLTAGHLADTGAKLQVQTFSAESYPRPLATYRGIEVLERMAAEDLALIRIATRDVMPGVLKVCPAGAEPRDAPFLALSVGCRHGDAPTCVLSVVNGKKLVRKLGDATAAPFWELEKALARGRSGGPLIDRRGCLIGVASLASDGKSYVAHVEAVLALLKRNGLGHLYEPDGK